MTKYIALASLKGGVSKSSLAVNIAGIAATEHRKRVLLVDADENRTSSMWFEDVDAPFDVAVTDEDARELTQLRQTPGIDVYDLVVVDLPGYRGQGLIDVLTSSTSRPDLVLTPTRAGRADLAPLTMLVPALDVDYRIVMNFVNSGRDRDAEGYADSIAQAGWKLAQTRVRMSKGWMRAVQEQRLVTASRLFPTAKTDARELTTEVLSILDAQEV